MKKLLKSIFSTIVMCIMLTEHDPENTNLIHLPVYIKDKKYNLCIYTNSQAVEDPSLMIVPFPCKLGMEIAMVDISTTKMKTFRETLYNLFPKPRFRDFSVTNSSDSESLMVHKIGNYDISIARSLPLLLNGINWSVFKKPSDFYQRVEALKDKQLYPEFPDVQWIYVVAQATANIKDDGFGIAYPDVGFDYFPTAHEHRFSAIVHQDVHCYHFTNKAEVGVGILRYISPCFQDKSQIGEVLKYVANHSTTEKGEQVPMKKIMTNCINLKQYTGNYLNSNLFLTETGGNSLTYVPTSAPEIPSLSSDNLTYSYMGRYIQPNGSAVFNFYRGSDGNVYNAYISSYSILTPSNYTLVTDFDSYVKYE